MVNMKSEAGKEIRLFMESQQRVAEASSIVDRKRIQDMVREAVMDALVGVHAAVPPDYKDMLSAEDMEEMADKFGGEVADYVKKATGGMYGG